MNKYIAIGPPAYLVLENLDYSDDNDIQVVSDISNALSKLSTVQPPVYSWVSTFR
jgi:Niemann-Pick C1 protein